MEFTLKKLEKFMAVPKNGHRATIGFFIWSFLLGCERKRQITFSSHRHSFYFDIQSINDWRKHDTSSIITNPEPLVINIYTIDSSTTPRRVHQPLETHHHHPHRKWTPPPPLEWRRTLAPGSPSRSVYHQNEAGRTGKIRLQRERGC
jgi:hypothetical protein